MLLILTSELDFAADYLIVRLRERNLPYFRLNSEELGHKPNLFRLTPTSCDRKILAGNGRDLDLDEVTAVWYRRALHPIVSQPMSPGQRHFVTGELRHLWAGLVLAPNKKWVNPIERVAVAEHKLLQLQMAQELGFNVPQTIVSRDPDELKRFVQDVGPSICKPIYHGLLAEGQERFSAYTRRVSLGDFEDRESI